MNIMTKRRASGRVWFAIALLFTVTLTSCGGGGGSYNPYAAGGAPYGYGGDIRSMPILDRPNRPGHFVGNTLRGFAGP
jgi:hypothetical protein